MSRMKTTEEYFVRGGQADSHARSMWLQNAWVIAGVSFLVATVAAYLAIVVTLWGDSWTVFWNYNAARFATAIKMGAKFYIDGYTARHVRDVLATSYHTDYIYSVVWFLIAVTFIGTFAVCAYFGRRYYIEKGKKAGEDEFLRGAKILTEEQLTEQVDASPEGRGPLTFGGIPIPAGVEQFSFLATGNAGVGKSQLLDDLMIQTFKIPGSKHLIFDLPGSTTTWAKRPDDVQLNALDLNCTGWNIYGECVDIYDLAQMADNIVPTSKDSNASAEFFVQAAKTTIASVMEQLWFEGKRTTGDLAEVLLEYGADEITKMIEGTAAGKFADGKAVNQSSGILATIVGAIMALTYVPSGDFSIRKWLADPDDDRRVFLTCHASVMDIIMPLFRMYVTIYLRGIAAQPESETAKYFLWVDELPMLGYCPEVIKALSTLRKYGFCMCTGIQNLAQMEDTYGEKKSQVLLSLHQNTALFRITDRKSLEVYSKTIGEAEYDEQSENTGFGASSSRDSSGVNTGRKERVLVMPSQLRKLPRLVCYMQFAGDFDVARVDFNHLYTKRKGDVAPFTRRPELSLENYRQKPKRVKPQVLDLDTAIADISDMSEVPAPKKRKVKSTPAGVDFL